MREARLLSRASAGIAGAAVVTVLLAVPGSPAAAAGETDYVTADRIAADGSAPWYADVTNAGAFSEAQAPDGLEALRLETPSSADGIRVLRRSDASSRPTDIPALLSGASYTYRGSNVNFQLELFFTPADPQYGPDAADPADRCTQAVDADGPVSGACYTVLKWEPFAAVEDWTTVDLSAQTAADSRTGTGGWKNTNRVGSYPKPGPLIGNTLGEYLAQMHDYTVIGAGVALGTGGAGSVGWVKDVAFGGVDHRFSAEPAIPTTVTLSAPAVAPAGVPLTVSAAVSPREAAGTVAFFDGAQSLGSAVVSGGAATITIASPAAGAHDLRAEFTPAAGTRYSPSASAHVSVEIARPVAPAPPPAASDADLAAVIASHGVDVAATTASFQAGDSVTLSAVDASQPFSGALPWTAADAFVDVYAYSTPISLGAFPVVDGAVRLSGLDLSALEAGGHHLVFVGQSSGELSAIALTVAPAAAAGTTPPASTLADTGSDPVVPLAVAALVVLCGIGALVVARRRRTGAVAGD